MKNAPLIVGISLPIVFIIMVMLFAFLPNLSVNPQYDFIYTTIDRDYYYNNYTLYQNYYEIVDGKIAYKPYSFTEKDFSQNPKILQAPPLYRYDAENNSVHALTFEEAHALTLTPGPSSPDGYSIEYRYGHDGIFELFGSSNNDNGYYITKGRGSKKLPHLTADNSYYGSNNYNLIGWVK